MNNDQRRRWLLQPAAIGFGEDLDSPVRQYVRVRQVEQELEQRPDLAAGRVPEGAVHRLGGDVDLQRWPEVAHVRWNLDGDDRPEAVLKGTRGIQYEIK